MREPHQARNIIIKKAKVDREIIPLVRWLNNQSDVVTLYSCQGGEDEGAHVMFISRYLGMQRIKRFAKANRVRLESKPEKMGKHALAILHFLYFKDSSHLRRSISWLRR